MSRATSSGEQAVYSNLAAVYNFSATTQTWESVDSGSSKIFVFHNPQINTYRVIGITADNQYIINTPIFQGLVHQHVDLFVQWRDTELVYGLSFATEEEAADFSQVLTECIENLRIAVVQAAAIPPPLSVPQQHPKPKQKPQPQQQPPQQHGKQQPAVPVRKARPPPPATRGPAPMPASMERQATGAHGLGGASFSLLDKRQEDLSDREKVLLEIFNTEKEYITYMTALVEECYVPVMKGKYKNLFSTNEIKQIYGNIEIVRSINIRLLDGIIKKLRSWGDTATIGDVFLQMLPFFKVYKEYYTGYEEGVALLEKLSKKKDVATYLKHCESVAQGHKLGYLLIMPVQRIPRYSLLLNELLKKTPAQHPDYPHLQKAHMQLKDFTKTINESVRETETYRKFAEQVKDNKKFVGFEAIVAPHRNLVFESEIMCKAGEKIFKWLYMFNDVLVFASVAKGKRCVEDMLKLEYVWFDDALSGASETTFRIITPTSMYLVDCAGDVVTKQKWITSANRTISAWLTKRGYHFEGQGEQRKFNFAFTVAGSDKKSKYDGWWELGQPHGDGEEKQGVFHYPNGNLYFGNFDHGKRCGKGKMIYNKNGGVYEGNWENDRPHGHGKLDVKGSVYEGNYCEGLRHGQGVMTWPNGDFYEGEWFRDRMQGQGKLTSTNGVYVGKFEIDMFNGQGTMTWNDGEYTGEWFNDRRGGLGKMTYRNGSTYEGQWKDDERCGQGKWQSGSRWYEGKWENNRMNGEGTYAVEGKYTFVGTFKEGRKHGMGKLTNVDGSSYDGGWADDRKEGQGIWIGVEGDTYEGHWHSDKRFGRGKFTDKNGSIYDGEWVNDHREGKGTITFPNGSKYSGNWVSDKRHGRGVYTSADEKTKYAGEWMSDFRHGNGVLTDATGTYEGEWKDDKRHGQGKWVIKDGVVFEGKFAHDIPDGQCILRLKDGSEYTVFWQNGVLESPGWDVLPPSMPVLKHFWM